MDATNSINTAPLQTSRWNDWRLLAILIAVVVPLRAWQIYNTEVVARDCIGYIRYGLDFEKKPWTEVVKSHHQHPGYASSVWAVSIPVRRFYGLSPESMQFSAQLASSLAAVLLMFPMFYVGKILFDREVAFWGTLLFQIFPISGHLLSDGLSEPLFFLFCICALLYAAKSMQAPSVWAFVGCGVFGGLAYWTRPEGLLIPIVTGVSLVVRQGMRNHRFAWRKFVAYGVAATASTIVVCAPYVWTTGKLSNKPSLRIILGRVPTVAVLPELRISKQHAKQLETVTLFGEQTTRNDKFARRLGIALLKFFSEIVQALHYIAWLPALLALWWHRRRLKSMPAFWVLLLFCLAQSAVVLALALKAGYVSYRHIMMLVFFGSFCAAAGVKDTAALLSTKWSNTRNPFPWRNATQWTLVLMSLMIAVCIPKLLKPLHRDRKGHHRAGVWLAKQLRPGDVVDDDHCWAHYYSGMVFREDAKEWQQPRPTFVRYVVMTRSSREHINEIRLRREMMLKDRNGRVVYRWPPHRSPDAARVVVYALPETRP